VLFSCTDKNGETYIVSTASTVLTATEQKYSTCEEELLALVYALNKLRIYVFGHKILLRTDNKAVSFLQKCTDFKQNRKVGSKVTRT
jgi:ribonuclease HI